jgi:dihydropteroate synthase
VNAATLNTARILVPLLLLAAIWPTGGESLWTPDFKGYLSGGKGFAVGDALVVQIDASSSLSYSASSNDSKNLTLEFSGGDSGNIFSFLPQVRTGGTQNAAGKDGLSLKTQIPVLVTTVNPDGTAQVQGSRTVTIQGKNESITVTGSISPGLLDQKATINFSKVANARLTYTTFLASDRDVLSQADLQRLLTPTPAQGGSTSPTPSAAATPASPAPSAQLGGTSSTASAQSGLTIPDARKKELLLLYLNRLIDIIFSQKPVVRICTVASTFLRSSETNAHPLDISSMNDVRRHLGEFNLSAEELQKVADSFLYFTVKLENVDTRAANQMKSIMEILGGGIAISKGALDFTVRKTDVLITGSRRTFQLLAARLKGEPYGLDVVSDEIVACISTGNRMITWGSRILDFTHKIYVMGILNCTPDSFYPSSRVATIKDALRSAHEMISAGVDIVDVGGESTRPGSDPVTEEEEIRRVIPVIQALRVESNVMVSVDTRKKEVAERALDAGADIINDISGLHHNEELARLVARRRVPIVLMHMRGTPKTMQKNPFYKNTISEILRELQPAIAAALGAGIAPEMIIVDPGIGFGKRSQDNLRIIRELASLKSLNFPILVGLSRKGFIGEIIDRPVEKRLIGTVTANTLAILNGANIIRVHDVADAVDMVKIIDSIRRIGS